MASRLPNRLPAPSPNGAGDSVLRSVCPEARLLCALVGRRPGNPFEPLSTQPEQTFDWQRFLSLAERHRLQPLVFDRLQRLSDAAAADVPKQAVIQLWRSHETNRIRNLLLADELQRLLGSLREAGIEAVSFKGPALAIAAYDDLALRQFTDLDLLVRQEQVFAARDRLQADGYRQLYEIPPDEEQAYLESARQYDLVMYGESSGILVELHWKTSADTTVEDLQDPRWWQRLSPQQLALSTLWSLPPNELLLVLCIHGAKHRWERLAWLVDIAELIRRQAQFEWALVLDGATLLRCRRRLANGLALARDLLGLALPDDVGRFVDRHASRREVRRASTALFADQESRRQPLRQLWAAIGQYDTLSQKIRHLALTACTPNSADWSLRESRSARALRLFGRLLNRRWSF